MLYFYFRKYCLVYAKPAILEIKVPDREMVMCQSPINMGISTKDVMCTDIFPKALVPDEEGYYKKIKDGAYIFVHKDPVSASSVKGSSFSDSMVISVPKLTLEPVPAIREFVPPKVLNCGNLFQQAYEKGIKDIEEKNLTAAEAICRHVSDIFQDKATEIAKLQQMPEKEIFEHTFYKVVGPFVATHELSGNDILLDWVKRQCLQQEAVIVKGNQFPTLLHATLHSNSRPDFAIISKRSNWAIVVNSDSLEEEEEEEMELESPNHPPITLYGVAGECKISNEGKLQVEGKPKAQLQANLFALAGLLAEQAMKSDVVFDEICVYGICCFYQDENGYLITLHLNFQNQSSYFVSDDTPHRIDQLIVHALRECKACNF